MESAGDLQSVFDVYAKDGQLECSKANKLFKDAGLIGKTLSTTDIDISFSKVKDKAMKKIKLQEFGKLVELLAQKLKIDSGSLVTKLSAQKAPSYAGTKAVYNKLHDDKSNYTGVYANGGPSNVDNHNRQDISGLCDRKEADVRGIKK